MADYCSFNVEIIGEGVDGPLLVLNSMIVEEFDGLYVDMDKMFPDKDDVSREQWIELARLPERQGRQVTIGGWTKYCPPFGMVERLSVLYPNLLFNLKGTTEHVLHEGWQYMSGECRQEYECLWLHREDVYECTVLDGVRLEPATDRGRDAFWPSNENRGRVDVPRGLRGWFRSRSRRCPLWTESSPGVFGRTCMP